MFVRRKKYEFVYECYKAALKGMWEAINKLEDCRKEKDLLESQVSSLSRQLQEAKRRHPDGKFKKIEGDFLTR